MYIGPAHRSRLLSYRFVCGSVLLASVVLGNYYSAIYTSILAVPRFQITIKSIEDVAADPNIKVYLFKDTPTENYVQVVIYLSQIHSNNQYPLILYYTDISRQEHQNNKRPNTKESFSKTLFSKLYGRHFIDHQRQSSFPKCKNIILFINRISFKYLCLICSLQVEMNT